MGVVNITPDSFSDGGRYLDPKAAIAHGRRLVDEGADLLDLGAESTRPGAPPLPERDELARLMPVLEGLSGLGVPLSVDTRKPGVMRAALAAGADMINDVAGFRSRAAVEAVAGSRAALVVMHMQGDPSTMQAAPAYRDVVAEVGAWLLQQADSLRTAGVAGPRIVLDPGIGFGKTVEHNVALLQALPRIGDATGPWLVGLSRKSLIGALTGQADPARRLAGSLAGALAAAARGAAILRVHDVAATREALAVWSALGPASRAGEAR